MAYAPPKQEVWGNRMLSGFTLNNSAVPPMVGSNYPQPAASLDSQFRMYKQNPIHGENGGRGPSRVSERSELLPNKQWAPCRPPTPHGICPPN